MTCFLDEFAVASCADQSRAPAVAGLFEQAGMLVEAADAAAPSKPKKAKRKIGKALAALKADRSLVRNLKRNAKLSVICADDALRLIDDGRQRVRDLRSNLRACVP